MSSRSAHARKVSALFNRLGPLPSKPSFVPPTFDQDAFAELQRSFARYARSIKGVILGNDKHDRIFHFDESVRYSVPHWNPKLVYSFLEFHCDQVTKKGKLTPADADIPVVLLATLQAAYNRARGRQLPDESYRAGQLFIKKWKSLCSPQRADLDVPSLLALAAAIFDPEYKVTFRQRFDMALYTALSCATGLGSVGFLSSPVSEGIRWRDFALWMTKDGPQAFLFSPSFRPYRLQDGPCLALSAAKLIAIGMLLDGVICGVTLQDLVDPAFWGGGDNERQVVQDFERSKLHVFRDDIDQPLLRADMNLEYARLSRLANLDGVVTTGCFRRLVGRQVFIQYGLEIASAVLGHRSMGQTKKFLERKMTRRIPMSHTTISGYITPRDAVTWATLYPYMKVFTLQNMTNYVDPRSWRDRYDRVCRLPQPVPAADPFLESLAHWMLGPPEGYAGCLQLASMLAVAQCEFALQSQCLWSDHIDDEPVPDVMDLNEGEDATDYPDSDDEG